MSLEIRYSLTVQEERITISSLDDITDREVRDQAAASILAWSQSTRELALRTFLAAQTSSETANAAQIHFHATK